MTQSANSKKTNQKKKAKKIDLLMDESKPSGAGNYTKYDLI
jgi:hypothetical protein